MVQEVEFKHDKKEIKISEKIENRGNGILWN